MAKRIFVWLVAYLVVGISSPSFALNIIFNDIAPGGSGASALAGFQAAADLWKAKFADPITVRLDVALEQLDPGVLGSTGPEFQFVSYTNVRNSLGADPTSADDATAVANLQPGSSLTFRTNDQLGNFFFDNDVGFPGNPIAANNEILRIPRANLKALGLVADDGSTDAEIKFNTNFTLDFDPGDGIAAGAFDFVGAAAHEIGHALGFTSGVDTVDFVSDPNGPSSPNQTGGTKNIDLDRSAVFSVLDLYRFSGSSINPDLGGGPGMQDLAYGDTPFFSIDGGATNLGLFSTGRFNGDGRQASHWKDNLGLGIMDPTALPGELLQISALDIQAFDVIGWDLTQTTVVPEPSSIVLLGTGLLGLTAFGGQRRKSRV